MLAAVMMFFAVAGHGNELEAFSPYATFGLDLTELPSSTRSLEETETLLDGMAISSLDLESPYTFPPGITMRNGSARNANLFTVLVHAWAGDRKDFDPHLILRCCHSIFFHFSLTNIQSTMHSRAHQAAQDFQSNLQQAAQDSAEGVGSSGHAP